MRFEPLTSVASPGSAALSRRDDGTAPGTARMELREHDRIEHRRMRAQRVLTIGGGTLSAARSSAWPGPAQR